MQWWPFLPQLKHFPEKRKSILFTPIVFAVTNSNFYFLGKSNEPCLKNYEISMRPIFLTFPCRLSTLHKFYLVLGGGD